MSRPKTIKPSHCHHKSSGRGYVRLNGQMLYTGKWGTQQSKDEYDRLIGEWIARARQAAPSAPPTPDSLTRTIAEILAAYWLHAQRYYVHADGSPTQEIENLKNALRPLRRLYGNSPALQFGPLALKAVQEEMIKMGRCRTRINRDIHRIKGMFKWATAQELILPQIHQGLSTVPALRRGRSDAQESTAVKPVADDVVEATVLWLSRQVKAMIELQQFTGMRPGEVCAMRGSDIDTTGKVWVYHPANHKNAHRGHDRSIFIGPKARAIVESFLKPNPQTYLFSPADAESERRQAASAARTTPATCGNIPGSNKSKSPERPPGDRYDVESYRRAIARACDQAFPPPGELARRRISRRPGSKSTRLQTVAEWRSRIGDKGCAEVKAWRRAHQWHPHQLRHSAATRLRKAYGIEAARVLLGHNTLKATEIYAEKDLQAAMQIMGQVG